MNTLFDAVSNLLNDYNRLIDLETSDMDSSEVFEIEQEEYGYDNYLDNDDYNDDYDEELDDEELDDEELDDEETEEIIKYKVYKIIISKLGQLKEDNYQEYVNLMSLLGLEYYNLYNDEYKNQEGDEVIQLMVDSPNKEEYSESIIENEDMLLQLISGITEVYCVDELESYDYEQLSQQLKDYLGINMYRKYHPNIEKEWQEYTRWNNENQAFEFFLKRNIDSLPKFIFTLCAINHNVVNKRKLSLTLYNKISNIRDKDKKLFDEIYIFMYEYAYLMINYKRENKIELNQNEKNIDCIINSHEVDNFLSKRLGIDLLIRNFIDYDLLNYSLVVSQQSEKTKKYIKTLNRYLK